MSPKSIDAQLLAGNLSSLLSGDGLFRTAANLIVPQHSTEALVKAEARKLAAEETGKNTALLFSRYAMLQNMTVYGAREKPRDTATFADLRAAAKQSFIDAILIKARTDQAKMVWQKAVDGKQVGFQVVHDRVDDPTFKTTPGIEKRCREMELLLSNPTPKEYKHLYPHGVQTHRGLKDFINVSVYAGLVFDRKVMQRYKRRDGKGYAAFHWIPGDTIKPVHEVIKEWMEKNPSQIDKKKQVTAAVINKMCDATGFDIWGADYVQIDKTGTICAVFTDDQISVHIDNPSDEMDHFGYGISRLENSLDVTTTVLYAWRYNQEMFKTNYPEQILAVTGNYDKAGLEAWKQQILGEAGGIGNNWRLPVIASDMDKQFGDAFDIKSIKLRESPKDMLFDNLFHVLCTLKCAAYGCHPSVINMTMDSGSSSNPFSSHNPVDEIEFSKEHGFLPDLMGLCEWFTQELIKPTYDDLKVMIVGLDAMSEKDKLDLDIQRVSKYITKNQQRVKDNDEPMGFWVATKEEYDALSDEDKQKFDSNPWNYPADAPIPTYLTSLAAKQQMEQQQAMMPDQGEEDGEGDYYDEGDNPWAAESYPAQEPVQKSMPEEEQREVKYLRISLE
jgi:hypothetical protein